jgi:hypothetical protein
MQHVLDHCSGDCDVSDPCDCLLTCGVHAVRIGPDELSFALIRLGYFLSVLTYMQAICWQLIWWPILDTRRAEWKAECYWQMHEEGSAGSPVRMRHAFSLEGGEITSSETRVQSPFS